MLVLTRRETESFTIGENIRIQVLKVNYDGTVKIGIEAPRSIAVVRDDAKITERKDVKITERKEPIRKRRFS